MFKILKKIPEGRKTSPALEDRVEKLSTGYLFLNCCSVWSVDQPSHYCFACDYSSELEVRL